MNKKMLEAIKMAVESDREASALMCEDYARWAGAWGDQDLLRAATHAAFECAEKIRKLNTSKPTFSELISQASAIDFVPETCAEAFLQEHIKKITEELNAFPKPVVVKYPEGDEWLVSFTSHNPAENECFVCKTSEDALRLKALVDSFVERSMKRALEGPNAKITGG